MTRLFSIIAIFLLLISNHRVYGITESDSLLNVYQSDRPDSLRVDAAIRLGIALRDDHPDSALIFLEQANQIAGKNDFQYQQARIQYEQAFIYTLNSDYPNALDHCLKAKEIIVNEPGLHADTIIQNTYLRILHHTGLIYIYTAQYKQALEYYDLLLSYMEQQKIDPERPLVSDVYLRVYINIGAVYLEKREFDQAAVYYTKALAYLDKDYRLGHAVILNNLGIIAYEKDELETALDYHKRAMSIRISENNPSGIAQSYNNLGNCYRKLEDYEQAIEYFKKGLKTSEENGLLRSNVISLHLLSKMYNELGDHEKAYQAFVEFKELGDSIVGQEKIKTITRLEQQYKFNEKLQLAQLRQEQLEYQKTRQQHTFLLIIGLAVLGIVILVLLYGLQRSKMKRELLEAEKVQLERKSLEFEKAHLEDELAYRNRELATKAMYLARTNEFIVNMSERLLKSKLSLNKENQQAIDNIIKELKTHSNKDVWEEFEVRFQQVHSDFYTRLKELYPNLSPNEKKLCAFLRLNMTTKEISAITYQTINSITVARTRLRKKLNMESDENLIAFLENL